MNPCGTTPALLHRVKSILLPASEWLGDVVGHAVSPLFSLTSTLRQARTFHPTGDVFLGQLELHPGAQGPDELLARRLEGRVLIRLSDALSKDGLAAFDVLGCAIRFGRGELAENGDQDLLFATIRRPWTMPFAPFTTETRDYLENDYFAVSPFQTPHHERAYFCVRPVLRRSAPPHPRPVDRAERKQRLLDAVRDDELSLELGVSDNPWGPYRSFGRVVIDEAHPDPRGLRFDPFRNGAGIEPRGFVHALRHGVYDASQKARLRVAPAEPASDLLAATLLPSRAPASTRRVSAEIPASVTLPHAVGER